jgi:hypothetical protein
VAVYSTEDWLILIACDLGTELFDIREIAKNALATVKEEEQELFVQKWV